LQSGHHERLSVVYHNLEADADMQTEALKNDKILLKPWELLVFSLFKALSDSSAFSESSSFHFYSEDVEEEAKVAGGST